MAIDDLLSYADNLERIQKQSSDVALAMVNAHGTNPDQYAKMKALERLTGTPASWMQQDPEIEAEARRNAYMKNLAANKPNQSVAGWLSEGDNAKLAFDDTDNANKIAGLFQQPKSTLGFGTEQDRKFAKKAQDQFIPPADFAGYIGRQFSAGQKGVELGRLDYARSAGDTTSATKQKAYDLFKTVSEAGKERDNLSGKIFGGAAEFMGQQYARLSNSFYRGMQGAVAGAAAGAVLSAPTAGLAAPITVAGGALTGFSAGFGAGFAEDAFITESGNMYRKLDDVKGANGETIETGIKQAVSVGYGTLSALVETASFGVLAKPFKDAAGKAAIKAGLVQGAEAAVKQALVSPTRTKAVLGALSTHQKAAFAESSEEAIQQALEITGTFAAKKLSAGTYSHDELEDIGGQVGGAFVDTYLAMLVPGSVGAGVQYRSNMQQVRQSQLNKDFMLALGESAGESKLRQRLPEKFQELLGRIRAGGPVENVYTPAEQFKTYWQEKGVDPYRMADTLVEDGAKQLAEAEAAGGDLVIPIESFATNLAATEHYAPLSEHIRLSPGDATAFEAAQLADEQEQVIADLRASAGEAVTNRPTHLKVYDDIMGQLQGIGYDRKTAEQYATLAAVRAKQRAAVLGVDAFELYNESPLKIVRPLPDGVQRQSVDMGLDPLLDRLRAGDIPTDESIFGQSLLQFVREKGVNDDRGDLKSMEVDAGRKPGQRNIIRPDGMPLDKLREAAVEAGYLNEGTTTADLLEAIDKELRGSSVYSNQTVDQQAFDTKLALDELKLHLDQVGLDYNQLSNEQIRRELYQGQGGELFQSLPEKIEIDGVERWTVNSKGQPIAQTEEGIRNFWRWFGDSKVVDEQGRPLVVYHGTDSKFNVFEKGIKTARAVMFDVREEESQGFFFSVNEVDASEYGKNLMPVYLKAEYPLVDPSTLVTSSRASAEELANAEKVWSDMEYILSAVVYEKETDGRKVIDTNSGISTLDVDPDGGWVSWALKDGYAEWDWLDNPEFVKRMEERGYDSARTVEPNDNSGFSWFVTNPTQIKSVSNSGTFDPQNPNILFQSAFKLPALDSLGQFETGKPVTFNFVHNTESATKIFGKPKKDSPYDRGFEPSGRYVAQVEDPKKLQLTDKMISGELTFVSPLVVEGKDWKKNLSVAFGKKRGKHLSKAVIAAGYDGIVTIQDGKSGKYVSEILDLTTFDEAKALYQTDRESPTPWLDHAKNTTEVQRTELQTALIKFFGKTRDHKEAGYVLPDGTMLDLSGRHYAEDHPTLRGQRSVDHRELFGENKNGFSLDDLLPDLSGTDAMAYIMAAAGAMRVDTASGVASSIGIPTPQQISVLGNALKGDYVSVSYVNPITGKIVDEAGIDSVNPLKIRRFYEQAKEKPDTFSYYQKQQIVKRGFFRPSLREIGLLKDADLSTFVHELGHSWLEELKADAARADAPDQLRADWATIAKWLGTTGDITREQHEQFARSGEAYLMEGKAPSAELQPIFQRFRSWLVSIYKTLTSLNVKLNDDVRGVFDRLLASEDEIKAARQGQKLVELFATKEEAGMTEAEFKAYRKEAEAAHNQEVTALEQKLMKELKREQADWWKEARADMQTVVEEEAFNDPVFKAIRMLSTGKHFDGTDGLNIKLDKAQLVKTYGEPFLKKLPRGFGYLYATENGLHPDVAAELFGFTSGDEMLRLMIEAPNIKQYIQGETDIRMKELYGDMMLDGTIADEAQEAIHNDLRGQVLAAELKALKRKQRASAPAVKAAEANDKAARVEMKDSIPSRESFQLAAAQIMADKKIGDISPATYLQAERRAAEAVFKATAKKDYAAAAQAKQQQMLNYYLYREAVKSQGQLEAMFKVYDKLKKPDKNMAKSRDVDMVNAARAILARFGIDRGGDNAMSYLQIIQQMNPEAYQDLSAAIDMATVDAKPYKQLTMPEMEQVHAAVLNLWNLSRRSKQVEIDGKLLNRDEVAAELAAGLEEIGLSDTKGAKRALTNKDRLITGLMGVRASMTRMEAWVDALDNNKPDGLFRKYLYNPIIDSINSYRVEFNNVMLQYKELAQAVEPHMDSAAIDAPEIDYTFKDTAELLGALLHTGNISNMEKLVVGRNWGFIADDGGLDTTAWDAFIRRMWDEGRLKKEHYDFVQGVWDLMEAQKAGAQKAHHAMYGHYFSEISADAFDTPFGEYRGGYAPAMSDAELNQDQAARQEREALESTNNSFMFPSAGRGFTKSRVKYNKPLVLDLRLVPAHIDKVLRFTFIEPRVKDIGRVVMTPAFRDVLGQYNSEASGQLIIPWLQRAAQQTTETPGSNRMADSFWRTIRRNTGLQLMVGNVSNTLQQFTGLFLSATKVKKTDLAASTLRYAMHPMQLTQQARDKSEMMQTRTMQSAYDAIQQAEGMIMNPNLYEKVKDANLKHGYILQQITQHTVDVITWDAAYNQAVAEGADEKIAVRRADSAVRMSQGSFNAEDLSKLETGTPFLRAMTQFFGYFNMQANLLGSQAVGSVRENGWIGALPKLMDLYAAFALASVVSGLIAYGFRGKGDDDDESLIWELLFKPQLQTAAAMIPVVGSGVNYMINKSDKNRYNDTMSVSPAVSMFMATLNVPIYAYQAAFTDTDLNNRMVVRDSLNALGMATGLPVGPMGRPLGYLAGMEEGRFEPKDNLDLVRGLIQGTASK